MRPRELTVNGPNRPLPLMPLLEILSHERLPVRIRLRYENPMSDSENSFAGLGATLDLNHVGVFARLYIVAGTFYCINEFINIV